MTCRKFPFRVLIAFFCFSPAFLSSCAKKSNEISHPTVKYDSARSLEDAQRQMQRASVQCESYANCPDQVAMVTFAIQSEDKKNWGVGRCTGFLIDQDVIMTNSHCIPDEFKTDPMPICRDRIRVVFPANSRHSSRSAQCQRVLSFSDIESPENERNVLGKPDFAFIRLDQSFSRRGHLKVETSGIPSLESVTIAKVNPRSTTLDGDLVVRTCKTVYPTVITPEIQSRSNPILSLSGCDLKPGNSGSPILDMVGVARAIAYAVIHTDSRDLKYVRTFIHGGSVSQISLGTNFACVPFPGHPQRALPDGCGNFASFEKRNELARQALRLPDPEISSGTPLREGWRPIIFGNHQVQWIAIVPGCHNALKKLKEEQQATQEGQWLSAVSFSTSSWKRKMQLTPDFQVNPRSESLGLIQARMEMVTDSDVQVTLSGISDANWLMSPMEGKIQLDDDCTVQTPIWAN